MIPMEQAVPDATGHGQSRLYVVHAQTTAGCGYGRYPRGRSVPALKNPSSSAPGEPEAQN